MCERTKNRENKKWTRAARFPTGVSFFLSLLLLAMNGAQREAERESIRCEETSMERSNKKSEGERALPGGGKSKAERTMDMQVKEYYLQGYLLPGVQQCSVKKKEKKILHKTR